MAVRIYLCGESVADLLEEVPGSRDFKLLLGGSSVHSAMGAMKAVKREKLDYKVGFVGPISTDTFGERFVKQFDENGIDISGVKRVDRNTTLAIVTIKPGKENDFSFYGRDTAEQMTQIADLPATLGTAGDRKICCFGSISTVMEPARFAWLEFAGNQRKDSLVFYDLNTRPKIAKDPERYRDIVADWARTAHIVKASDADIGWAYPGKSMREVADIWLKAGARMAVFTNGGKGSEAYTHKISAKAQALDLIATQTVGAGDNFNAGIVINLAKENKTTPEAIDALTEGDLTRILSGANNIAAAHLISIGAKLRSNAL